MCRVILSTIFPRLGCSVWPEFTLQVFLKSKPSWLWVFTPDTLHSHESWMPLAGSIFSQITQLCWKWTSHFCPKWQMFFIVSFWRYRPFVGFGNISECCSNSILLLQRTHQWNIPSLFLAVGSVGRLHYILDVEPLEVKHASVWLFRAIHKPHKLFNNCLGLHHISFHSTFTGDA